MILIPAISSMSSAKRSSLIWRRTIFSLMLATGLTLPVTNSIGQCPSFSNWLLKVLNLSLSSLTASSYGSKKFSQSLSIKTPPFTYLSSLTQQRNKLYEQDQVISKNVSNKKSVEKRQVSTSSKI